jgi:beta-glucosidase
VKGDAKPIDQSLEVNTKTDVETFIEVTKAGVYDCMAKVSYERNPLAQSTCSIALNGEFAFTVFGQGTEGKTVEVEGAHLRLQPGVYRLTVHFVKPGMKLEKLEFSEVS